LGPLIGIAAVTGFPEQRKSYKRELCYLRDIRTIRLRQSAANF